MKINYISLTKSVCLLGLWGSLFIPLSDLNRSANMIFSFITAMVLIYAFYIFDSQNGRTVKTKVSK